tara:strand:+ start:179 stop:1546 length:1368 start_codon:yes stop_codon:yes gene_type:complete
VNILSLHLSHEGCATYIENNKIKFHTQIDRYNRFKYFSYPTKHLINIFEKLPIDTLLLSYGSEDSSLDLWIDVLKTSKKLSKLKVHKTSGEHHLFHAYCSLTWNKDLKNILVCDGTGASYKDDFERESFYTFNKDLDHVVTFNKNDGPPIGLLYEEFTKKHFNNGLDCGKTMAWSIHNKEAFQIQSQFVNQMNELIANLEIKEEVIFTGGCAQNVLFNQTLLDKFERVFCDPFNSDFGLSLGFANFYCKNQISNETVYLGIEQNLDTSIFSKHDIVEITPEEVSDILVNHPVAIFQSKSEQGQRGLGNRSLLMNATHKEAQDKLNKIKKREWFRPFACSILEEKAHEWFDMKINKSPHMMYTFNLKKDKQGILKSGTSIDNKSRIQTVSKKDNLHFYNLINSFYKKTQIPLIINTSLNLPGEVVVETMSDLKELFTSSSLCYIYLPETKQLIIKK